MKCASCRTGELVNATHSYFAGELLIIDYSDKVA